MTKQEVERRINEVLRAAGIEMVGAVVAAVVAFPDQDKAVCFRHLQVHTGERNERA
jgi:hypothetical protein